MESSVEPHTEENPLADGTTEMVSFQWYTGDSGHGEADAGYYRFRVELDPDQMKQVILNVLLNAFEVMPDHGTVTLEARTSVDGRTMLIGISDTGGGIAKEDLPRLFQPFFTTKPIGKGTGLGLAIASES